MELIAPVASKSVMRKRLRRRALKVSHCNQPDHSNGDEKWAGNAQRPVSEFLGQSPYQSALNQNDDESDEEEEKPDTSLLPIKDPVEEESDGAFHHHKRSHQEEGNSEQLHENRFSQDGSEAARMKPGLCFSLAATSALRQAGRVRIAAAVLSPAAIHPGRLKLKYPVSPPNAGPIEKPIPNAAPSIPMPLARFCVW